ncbi:divergent polysaccharide deacetylase family protein [Halovulum dunhuangense]|uniref:Divergent polysaccharide deacetylase family protein n=1 Tax=Halovulum dunhuangense TaxID=1505036 RepID=A0A849L362_9RHOB|nr:divergent polysaccharide deacetylase family protein [Halovulum dunhuangense]NNU80693.1 divergent polysaccharide deacetylase family protein [Halovulum dunhuangense]
MIRYLFGVVLGMAAVGAVLAAVAVLVPSENGPIAAMRDAGEAAPEAGPEAAPRPEPEPAPASEPEPAPTPEPAVPEPAAPEAGPEAAAPPIPEGPSLGTPAPGGDSGALGPSDDAAPSRIASAPQPAPQMAAPGAEAAPSVNVESAAVPQVGTISDDAAAELIEGDALAQNAVAFEAVGSQTLMAVILIDEGADSLLRGLVSSLGVPVTMGVTADIQNAGSVASAYRDAGVEVVAVLPSQGALGVTEGMSPAAVEPLLAEVFQRVPLATAVMDPINGPMPRDRDLTDAVLEALTVTGHGLLTHRGTGLNNVPLIADEAGVYSDVVYRVIDDNPGAANIALELGRGVLDASRGGSVIVVGRLRPETMDAIAAWTGSNEARSVTLAPVSAVLR